MDTIPTLSSAEQAENYNLFSELMKKGVKLKDLTGAGEELDAYKRKMEELTKHVADLETRIKQQTQSDVRTYEMMYRAVKDDPDVKQAHEATSRQKSIAIHNLCMGDNAYRTCYDAERLAVEVAYKEVTPAPSQEG